MHMVVYNGGGGGATMGNHGQRKHDHRLAGLGVSGKCIKMYPNFINCFLLHYKIDFILFYNQTL